MYFSELKKNTLKSIGIVTIIYLFLTVFNLFLVFSTERIEFAFALGFAVTSIFYFFKIKNENIVKNHTVEMKAHFMYVTNLIYIFSFLLVALDYYVFQVYFDMKNASISNFILLIVLSIPLYMKYFDYENYLSSAYTDMTLENLYDSIHKVPPRAMPKGTIELKEKDKKTLIAHEIGHLMMLLPALKEGNEVMVSIVKEQSSLGYVLSDIHKNGHSKKDLEDQMRHYLGGGLAELYESQKEGSDIKEVVGRSHDMALYSKVATEYLKNGFNIHESYITAISSDSSSQVKDGVEEFNQTAYKALHLRMYSEGYDIILKNKDIYEELKDLLEEKLVLYIEDIKPYIDRFNQRSKN